MSFVHFLTIGRFGFGDATPPPHLRDRAVFPVLPDELRQDLGRTTPTYVVPFSESELEELEEVVRRRFDVDVKVKDFLTKDRLLRIQYTDWVRVLVAEHVAVVAHELFGAVAADRDQFVDPARLERRSQECAIQNAERRRIFTIADGCDRMAAVIESLERDDGDPKRIPAWLAVEEMRAEAGGHVSDLIRCLSSQNPAVSNFACLALERLGPAATEAIPALTSILRDRTSDVAFGAARALGAMGEKAEAGLVIALDHPGSSVAWTALTALSRLRCLSDRTRARLGELASGDGEPAKAARDTLRRLGDG